MKLIVEVTQHLIQYIAMEYLMTVISHLIYTQGQLCRVSEAKGIGCSNGKQSKVFVL